MKRLILNRHAKSSWDNPDFTDFDRPLNSRGLRDVPSMADLFLSRGITPDLILSSPAVRAISTAKVFANELGIPEEEIQTDMNIYEQGAKYIIKLLKTLANSIETIMIFGHNPDITSLASYYSGDYFDNVPTCGMVCIEFNIDDWSEIENENGNLVFFEFPKKMFED